MGILIPRRMRLRVTRDTKTKIAWSLFIAIFFVIFIDNFGFIAVYFEKDFETEFVYPMDAQDFPDLVNRFRNGEHIDYEPINTNYSGIKFQETANHDCGGGNLIGLLILVKSAPNFFDKRAVIRATWGQTEYLLNISNSISPSSSLLTGIRNQLEKNLSHRQHQTSFSTTTFPIKLVFLVGQNQHEADNRKSTNVGRASFTAHNSDKNNKHDDNVDLNKITNKDKYSQTQRSTKRRLNKNKQVFEFKKMEDSLRTEILKYKDIVRADFVDSYENNTYKTMLGLRWAVEICTDFQYAFLVDDDMYISVKNLIKFMEAPKNYPVDVSTTDTTNVIDVATEKLFAGKTVITRPVRNKLGWNKWYLSLDEYPFNYFPPYLPAASILMSKPVVEDFYYASYFTQHFRFDDVFLGLLAYKMKITPFDSNYFHVCHSKVGLCADYSRVSENDPMQYVIARHGLSSPKELIEMWNEQKLIGNC